jgi:hypothetical protein
MIENKNKKLVELDTSRDVCFFLSLLDIQYDTKQKISGKSLISLKSQTMKESLK